MPRSFPTPIGPDIFARMKTMATTDFKGKRALIRVDFNVPLNAEFQITDDTRIRAALPTINEILANGGSVILMSHLGRPKEGPTDKYSLRHLMPHLSTLLGREVLFATDCIGEDVRGMAAALRPGQVLMLENLRFYKEEEKGDSDFAGRLAALGDMYVNDAFGTAHRAHASTTIVADFFKGNSLFGHLMAAEVANAERVLRGAAKPLTAILGGAKVSDKILIIDNLLNIADCVIIGGGMSYTFFRAKGLPIGKSICEDDKLDVAREVMRKAAEKGVRLLLPVDHVVADAFAADAKTQVCSVNTTPDGWMGLDIGPETINLYREAILNSKTLLWNGPMGVFEMEKFQTGTVSVANAVADATAKGAFSLVGGGDSVAAVNKFDLADKVSYVSTGGGAMLEFFEGKELPGVKAIG